MVSDTRQHTYLFFIKLAMLCRQFYKEHIGILPHVASRVNRPVAIYLDSRNHTLGSHAYEKQS